MSNNILSFPVENLVISDIKNKKKPRLILANKAYPIALETPVGHTPFGIDNVYGKFYMKLTLNKDVDMDFIELLKKIEKRLQTIIPSLLTNFTNSSTFNTILDKNVKIEDDKGNIVSMFGIEKGDCLKTTIELSDIYNDKNYKWIVKKIIRLR